MTKRAIRFTPKSENDELAWEIAQGFGDEVHLPLFRQICSAHDRTLVWRAFREVMAISLSNIRKSRRAYFIYLIRKYEKQQKFLSH